MTTRALVLHAVGDLRFHGIGVETLGPDAMLDFVRPVLTDCDVLFGNCEGPWPAETPIEHECDLSCNVGTLKRHRFDVVSLANNHIFDEGRQGVLDTVASLRGHGIAICGAGSTPEEAWAPAILEVQGRKIGFLAFTSYGPKNTLPRPKETAHLHADTAYEQVEPLAAGITARDLDASPAPDLEALDEAVRSLRPDVDLLFVSFHWGVHEVPLLILDYMRDLAHTAIDAGADGVLGHHQHILQGIDFYAGRPIFYGLNELYFQSRAKKKPGYVPAVYGTRYGDYTHRHYTGWHATVNPLSRMHIIARLEAASDGQLAISIAPMHIEPQYSRPVSYDVASETGQQVIEFLNRSSEFAGLSARVETTGSGPFARVVPA